MRQLKRLPLFLVFAGTSATIGLLIPTVYECEFRGSRFEWAALFVASTTVVLSLIIAWPKSPNAPCPDAADGQPAPLQFGLRSILVAVSLVAIVFAVAARLDNHVANFLGAMVAVGAVAWSLFQEKSIRAHVGSIVACSYLPLLWVIEFSVPIGRISGLAESVPMFPGILHALLIRSVVESLDHDQVGTIALVIVAMQLLLGVALAIRGGKLYFAYTVYVLALSTLSSFFVFVGTRA